MNVKRFKAVIDELEDMEVSDSLALGATSVVLASDYDALQAERDALRADAERYRWLKRPERLGFWRVQQWEVEGGDWNPDKGRARFVDVRDMDDSIDEAMSSEVEGEKHG